MKPMFRLFPVCLLFVGLLIGLSSPVFAEGTCAPTTLTWSDDYKTAIDNEDGRTLLLSCKANITESGTVGSSKTITAYDGGKAIGAYTQYGYGTATFECINVEGKPMWKTTIGKKICSDKPVYVPEPRPIPCPAPGVVKNGVCVGGDDTTPVLSCSYAPPRPGCTYVPGPEYNPTTDCGLVLKCSGDGPAPKPMCDYYISQPLALGNGETEGAKRNDVLMLQKILMYERLLTVEGGVPTGYFGNMTMSAVKAFQMSVYLPPTGIADSATVAKLNAVCTGVTTTGTGTTKAPTPTVCPEGTILIGTKCSYDIPGGPTTEPVVTDGSTDISIVNSGGTSGSAFGTGSMTGGGASQGGMPPPVVASPVPPPAGYVQTPGGMYVLQDDHDDAIVQHYQDEQANKDAINDAIKEQKAVDRYNENTQTSDSDESDMEDDSSQEGSDSDTLTDVVSGLVGDAIEYASDAVIDTVSSTFNWLGSVLGITPSIDTVTQQEQAERDAQYAADEAQNQQALDDARAEVDNAETTAQQPGYQELEDAASQDPDSDTGGSPAYSGGPDYDDGGGYDAGGGTTESSSGSSVFDTIAETVSGVVGGVMDLLFGPSIDTVTQQEQDERDVQHAAEEYQNLEDMEADQNPSNAGDDRSGGDVGGPTPANSGGGDSNGPDEIIVIPGTSDSYGDSPTGDPYYGGDGESTPDVDNGPPEAFDLPAEGTGFDPGAFNDAGGGGGCFTGDTKILMADGSLKDIKEVVVGDYVTSSEGPRKVLKLFQKKWGKVLYAFNGDENYFVTGTHPFMTTEGWKSFDLKGTAHENPGLPVTLLQKGDVLKTNDGSLIKLNNVDAKIVQTTVYNLDIEGEHDYYANGYWVHNIQSMGKGGGGGDEDPESGWTP